MNGSSAGASAGTIAIPPGGSASSSSAFARATFSMLPSSSRCAGAIAVMTPTSGRAIAASARDLTGPAHAHLGDDDLGVRLDPGERERQRRSRC